MENQKTGILRSQTLKAFEKVKSIHNAHLSPKKKKRRSAERREDFKLTQYYTSPNPFEIKPKLSPKPKSKNPTGATSTNFETADTSDVYLKTERKSLPKLKRG